MSVNTQLEHSTSSRPLPRALPILSMVVLCLAVDITGVLYVAQHWDYVSQFAPHLLLAMTIAGLVLRVRSKRRLAVLDHVPHAS